MRINIVLLVQIFIAAFPPAPVEKGIFVADNVHIAEDNGLVTM